MISGMSSEAIVTLAIAVGGVSLSWCAWVTISIFNQLREIALLKQELAIMEDVKDLLTDIRDNMSKSKNHG